MLGLGLTVAGVTWLYRSSAGVDAGFATPLVTAAGEFILTSTGEHIYMQVT